jgi:hypothetical protein
MLGEESDDEDEIVEYLFWKHMSKKINDICLDLLVGDIIN